MTEGARDAGAGIEPTEGFVELASGVTLHTLEWVPPAGQPTRDHSWVLTHGLASNARLWDGVARRLAADGFRVVTVDQRGHGLSSKPDGPFDVPTCATDLALLIEEIGLERPAVAGQSWGGNVVLQLGHDRPDLVSMICCVDGGFIELQQRFPDWDATADQLRPPPLIGTPVERMRAWIDSSAADWPDEGRAGTMHNFEVRADGTIAPWLTLERHMQVLRGLWEHHPSVLYPEMKVPVLFVLADSGGDPMGKSDAMDVAVGSIPTVRVEWFRPAHHDVHAQKPAEVAHLLVEASTGTDFFETNDR